MFCALVLSLLGGLSALHPARSPPETTTMFIQFHLLHKLHIVSSIHFVFAAECVKNLKRRFCIKLRVNVFLYRMLLMNKTFKIKIPSSFLFLSRFSFSPPSHEQDVPVSVGLSERLRFQISPVGGFNEVLSVKPDDSRGQTNQISAL